MGRRASSTAFVGRRDELGALRSAAARAVDDGATIVIVGGEAGIGKSRLVAEFAAWARSSGMLVLHGSCIEIGQGGLPYGPIVQALRPWARGDAHHELPGAAGTAIAELSRWFPELYGGSPDAEEPGAAPQTLDQNADRGRVGQARLLELILRLLGSFGQTAATVLVIEDLHWADPGTRDLVAFLAQNLHDERLLLVTTLRTDWPDPTHEFGTFLARLELLPSVERVDLGALTSHDVEAQLAGILGTPADAGLVAEIVGRSDGNPFFVEELLQAALAEPGAQGLTRTLRELLLARVASLSEPAVAVCRAAAVGGGRADEELLVAVTGLDGAQLVAALREAVAANVLLPAAGDRDAYAFRHALVAESITADLLPTERRRLHAAVAEFLAGGDNEDWMRQPGVAAELARHWEAARHPARALRPRLIAGDAARRSYDFRQSAEHYVRALASWGDVPNAAEVAGIGFGALLQLAARSTFLAGDITRAVELQRQAVDHPGLADLVDGAEARRALGTYLSSAGRYDEAIDTLRAGLALLADEPAPLVRGLLLTGLGAQLMLLGRFEESRVYCEGALEIAVRAGIPEVESQARNFLGIDLGSLGRLDEGIEHLQTAVTVAGHHEPATILLEAINNLAVLLDWADRLGEGVDVATGGIRRARELGLERLTGGVLRTTAAAILRRLGRWAEAVDVATDGLRMNPEREVAISLHRERATILAWRGELDAAERDLLTAERLAGAEGGEPVRPHVKAAVAELALWRGDPDRAAVAVESALHSGQRTEPQLVAWLGWLGVRSHAERAAAGRARRITIDVDDAVTRGTAMVRQCEVLIEAFRGGTSATPSIRAAVDAGRGETARLLGTDDPEPWLRAAAAWDEVPVAHAAAYARYRAAEALLATSTGRERATELLTGAARTATDLNARPLAEAISILAQRARIRLTPVDRVTDGAPRDVPAAARAWGLTPRELEVLALIAQGRTNRQIAEALFISEKTSGVHVTNLLGKLGVNRRADAAAIYDRSGLASDEPTRTTGEVLRTFLGVSVRPPRGLVEAIGPDGWHEVRRAADAILGRLVADAHGEIISRTDDTTIAAFADATLAAECAISLQRGVREQRRLRGVAPLVAVAVHLGAAIATPGGWDGAALREVERILSAASQDEVLVSGAFLEAASRGVGRRAGSPRSVQVRAAGEPLTVFVLDWTQSV